MYELNPTLQDFWMMQARYKILYGGRASSKSHDAAGVAVFLAANYKLKFMCARQFQNKISDSVYSLLKDKIENSEYYDEFKILKNSIVHKYTGSEFIFYGIARNLNEIKSTNDVDILWLEEANYLTGEQWRVINPTIREEGSQVWVIFNPGGFMDFAYQNFVVNPPENSVVRKINWDENPFLSQTMLDVIRDDYKRDYEEARHVYGGEPRMGDDKSVISLKYILAATDAHKKIDGWEVKGKKRIGFDIADDGEDLCATIEAHGNIAIGGDEWKGLEDELLKSSTRVYNRAVEIGADIIFDSIGVGAHAGAKFKELNESRNLNIGYSEFNAGSKKLDDPDGVYVKLPHVKILNKEHFSNKKAQKWDEIALRFRKTYEVLEKGANHDVDELISIDSESFSPKVLKKLQMELSQPKKDVDSSGLFKVESKEDMKKRGIKSPNLADAFIMAMMKPKKKAVGFFSDL